MMDIVETLARVVCKPAAAMNEIAREKPVGWALGIFAAATLLNSFTADYSALEELIELPMNTPYLALFQVISSLAGLFVITGLLYLVSLIFKGTGGYWGLFSALGFAQFPAFLNPVAAVIGKAGGAAGAILSGLLTFAVLIWVLVLNIIALRESRTISTGASIGTYVITSLAIGIAVAVGILMIVLALGGLGALM